MSRARCPGCQREAEVNRPGSGSLITRPWPEAIGVDPARLELVPDDCDASEYDRRRIYTPPRGPGGLTGNVGR